MNPFWIFVAGWLCNMMAISLAFCPSLNVKVASFTLMVVAVLLYASGIVVELFT
jgi:hypothetical protein